MWKGYESLAERVGPAADDEGGGSATLNTRQILSFVLLAAAPVVTLAWIASLIWATGYVMAAW